MKATSGTMRTEISTRNTVPARTLVRAMLAVALIAGGAGAQYTPGGRTPRSSVRNARRPYTRKPTVGPQRPSPLGRARVSGMNRNGTSTAQIDAFLDRPGALLRGSSFTAPIRRLTLGSTAATRMYTPTQADMDRAIEEINRSGVAEQPDRYAENMWGRIVAQRRRLLEDGWAYFKDRDYLRARTSFQAAGMVDGRAPAPRFGKLIVDVTNKHFRRAMTQLAQSVTYDSRRPAGVEGLFEYNISLRRAFGSEDDLRDALFTLRQFAQQNLDIPPVQALYCFVLWYSRYNDAMVEAASIAARLRRTATNAASPWARFDDMIREARRKIDRTRQAPGATDTTAPG